MKQVTVQEVRPIEMDHSARSEGHTRCEQCEKGCRCSELYGYFLNITGPEVGDAALNLYLDN